MTLDVYADLFEEQVDSVADAMDLAYRAAASIVSGGGAT